jgi:hypothetical protein
MYVYARGWYPPHHNMFCLVLGLHFQSRPGSHSRKQESIPYVAHISSSGSAVPGLPVFFLP